MITLTQSSVGSQGRIMNYNSFIFFFIFLFFYFFIFYFFIFLLLRTVLYFRKELSFTIIAENDY